MSELRQKLRCKDATGKIEQCSLYTTLDECPYPNFKVNVNGTQAYAKLGSTGSKYATKIRVHAKDGNTYAIWKCYIKAGKVNYTSIGKYTFTVPNHVSTLKLYYVNNERYAKYIHVTPNTNHTVSISQYTKHTNQNGNETVTTFSFDGTGISNPVTTKANFVIEWSEEINNH